MLDLFGWLILLFYYFCLIHICLSPKLFYTVHIVAPKKQHHKFTREKQFETLEPTGSTRCWTIYVNTASSSMFSHSNGGLCKEAQHPADSGLNAEGPIFFNYHEFAENYYADLDAPQDLKEHDEEHGLCITHFPNVYVPGNSPEFQTTRIVRVPRRFESTLDCPVMSTLLPGVEPGAISGDINFQPHGYFDDDCQLFGYSSVSPLSGLLRQEKFEEVVSTINNYLQSAFYIYSWFNLMDFFLEVVSLGLWRLVSKHIIKHPLLYLEDYVDQVNESEEFKERGVKIISPRRSGYLSVCVALETWLLLLY